MTCEARFSVQWSTRALSSKCSKSYDEVMGWVQTRLTYPEQQTYVCRCHGSSGEVGQACLNNVLNIWTKLVLFLSCFKMLL